jgi:hypothetical protein
MSVVLPVMMVSGNSPLIIYILLLVNEQINASSSTQWPQSTLGEPVLIIFWDTPILIHGYNPQRPAATGSRVQSVLRGNQPCVVFFLSHHGIFLSNHQIPWSVALHHNGIIGTRSRELHLSCSWAVLLPIQIMWSTLGHTCFHYRKVSQQRVCQ